MSLPHGVTVVDGIDKVQQTLVYLGVFLTSFLHFTVVPGVRGTCSVLTHTSSVVFPQPGPEVSRGF